MKVVYSFVAQQDLLDIHKQIFDQNPVRALSFIEEIETAAAYLAEMPLAFPIMFEHEGLAIRRRVYKKYLIFYRVEKKQIIILRVGHGAQDWARIFSALD